MIDGSCLATFVAIAEEGSFTRAADRMNIAQSVVSKKLKRLEDQLSAQLVDRSIRSNIRLTQTGRLFLPEASATVARLEAAERTGRNLARGRTGPLRIGFIFSAAMNGTLTQVLTALSRRLPELELRPQLMETPEQLKALEAGLLDLALVRPRPSYPDRCQAAIVHSEAMGILLALDHHLASLSSIAPGQLATQRFVLPHFDEQMGLIGGIRRLSKAGGFDLPDIVRTADYVTAACLTAANIGVALAPAALAKLGIEGIGFRPLIGHDENLITVLVHRQDAPAQAVECIHQTLSKTAQN